MRTFTYPSSPARSLRDAFLVAAAVVAWLVAPPIARAERRPLLRIVVDPGHGGTNAGAAGHVEGVQEKRVTLAVARLLRKRLERDGISVVVTRESDAFLTLAERVRRANSTGADLFLSIHANASPGHQQRGVEAFVLARDVRDLEAHRSGTSGKNPGGPSVLLPVLTDPAAPPRQTIDPAEAMLARARVRLWALESARLARAVQGRLVAARGGDRGVHQAPFDVLENLAMPATLVEIGFLDHDDEGRELLRPDVLRRVADAIADGVEDYSTGAELADADGTVAP